MTRYTHTMCMAFGADGEPDRVEVDVTFDYLVAGSAVSDIRVLKIDGRDVNVADADLHDRIHDDLESGRFDDLLISLVTPSPQSVVVPVDDLAQEIRRVDGNHSLGAGALAEALLPFLSERLAAAPAPSSLAGGEVRQELIELAIHKAIRDEAGPGLKMLITSRFVKAAASAILAALSPEAPAREGANDNPLTFGMGELVVNTGKFGGDNAVFIARAKEPGEVGAYTGQSAFDRKTLQPGELVMIFPTEDQVQVVANALVGALTPRHEAPASEGDAS